MQLSRLFSSKILLIFICVFYLFISFYKISQVPPALSWDEASVGYDAWSITHDGKDQWGQFLPVAFKSFEEYKYPFHIYTTALFVKLFGLSDVAVRAPSVIFGLIDILLVFFVVRLITQKKPVAILSSLFLAISPWFIQFSRVNWETNFALFFLLSGLLFFFQGLRKKPYFLMLAFTCFGFDLYTYNAAKIFIPLFLFVLVVVYFKELIKLKFTFLISIVIFLIISSISILNPQLSGLTRFQQVKFDDNLVRSTMSYKLSKKYFFGKIEIIGGQYLSHFNPQFLFISGDKNPRHSSQTTGQLYWLDFVLIPLGIFFLLRYKKKYGAIFLAWFFLAPLPGSITIEAPHASRAMFALGSWQIVSAWGAYYLFQEAKNKISRKILGVFLIVFYLLSFSRYYYNYINIYPIKSSQDWQYGYKKIFVSYKDTFNKFDHIIISDYLSQPYIFALYYLKYNPLNFRAEVEYNTSIKRSTSLVKSFGKFIFTNIKFSDLPKGKSLVFASPSEQLSEFSKKDVILNLDKSIAFYVYEYEK